MGESNNLKNVAEKHNMQVIPYREWRVYEWFEKYVIIMWTRHIFYQM